MTELYLARSRDERIVQNASHGGAVTALLAYALQSDMVDAVLTVRPRSGSRYEGLPALISDPDDVIETAGALHCTSPNIARCLHKYLNGALNRRVAIVGKPCDMRAIIELAKRKQIARENLILIGLNCTGTMAPTIARRMFREAFDVDPDDVQREDVDDGRLTVTLSDGSVVSRDLDALERAGYGRRDNCRRCEVSIPTMADLACGHWGAEGTNATCVQVCSARGSDLWTRAIEAGVLDAEPLSAERALVREAKRSAAARLAQAWRAKQFAALGGDLAERFALWSAQFEQCIKCFGCRDACPICYCTDCRLEADRDLVPGGVVPPDLLFPLIRTIHVADSCVNCGQCQDACPAELPLATLTHMLNVRIDPVLGYAAGMDASEPPPLTTVPDKDLAALRTRAERTAAMANA